MADSTIAHGERQLNAAADEARQGEAERRREQAFVRTVLDSVSSMVMVRDAVGCCLLANEAAARFHGMTVATLEGKDCRDIATLPAESLARDREVLETGRDTTVEAEADGADGHRHSLIVSRTPLIGPTGRRDRVLVTSVDITWRKRAEHALRESESKFRSVFEQAAIGIGRVRFSDARWIDVNDAFCNMLGRTRDEMLKTPWPEITHPEDIDLDLVPFRKMAAGELRSYTIEKRFIHKNGGHVWARLTLSSVFDREGKPDYEVAVIEDITDRKRAEQALLESDRQKDQFIAVLSHELRNPLAPIRYALPLLEREELGEPAERAVQVVDRQVAHLTRLVDDLLDVSRITRGKVELRRELATLGSIVNTAVEAASPGITAARHNLKLSVADEPIWLYADPARVAQIITNLLNNSAKYTPRGGQITLEVGREGSYAVIRVRDNGVGIPAEALPTVFEMFRQVRRHEGKSQGGLGIGLGLVKSLVQMHGGDVEAHSGGIGQGAEFVVRLPVAKDGTADVAEQQAERPCAARRKLRVLVVDDNADLVEMLSMVVETAGHDVRKALDGRSAISAALSYRPDVVLLDLGLPVIGGLDVARELRQHPETKRACLVALTGWGQAEDRRETEEAGFDAHLTKPTDPHRVERLLAEVAHREEG